MSSSVGETLGQGHPHGARLSREVGNYTVAGVATRVSRVSPVDADWGQDPPPIGTLVIEGDGILWAKTAVSGGWVILAVAQR